MMKEEIDNVPFVKGFTGVILAGGMSSRFGSNKAFAEINGTPLIKKVVNAMGAVFGELIIIANSPQDYSFLNIPVHEDMIKGFGPLGGIYTGLQKMPGQFGFFVACDMPFLNGNLIRYITDVTNDDLDAVVPRVDWKMEPLHALYSKNCIHAIKELIDAGECMISKFFQAIRVRFINEQEIRKYDPMLRSFFNINRPGELHDAAGSEGVTQPKITDLKQTS